MKWILIMTLWIALNFSKSSFFYGLKGIIILALIIVGIKHPTVANLQSILQVAAIVFAPSFVKIGFNKIQKCTRRNKNICLVRESLSL